MIYLARLIAKQVKIFKIINAIANASRTRRKSLPKHAQQGILGILKIGQTTITFVVFLRDNGENDHSSR